MRLRTIGCLATAAALGWMPATAQAHTLTDGNSSAEISENTGMVSWVVDGVNNIAQENYWYRIGIFGGEINPHQFATATAPNVTLNSLELKYVSAQMEMHVFYTLTGGGIGSNTSTITKTVTVTNIFGEWFGLHLFHLVDADMGEIALNNYAELTPDISSKITSADQIGNGMALHVDYQTPGDYGQVDYFATLLIELSDASPTTLAGDLGPAGPDDLAFAVQWSIGVENGATVSYTQVMTIAVPEPASIGVLALGAMALLRRKRAG